MENPVLEISSVIHHLTQSPPAEQLQTIEKFFTPNASFVHPFCRIHHFTGSRWVIKKIYQWYKVMSPRIEMNIHSIAYDEHKLKLYVNMSQIFTIWIIPFHVAPVTLTTVLDLTTDPTGETPNRGRYTDTDAVDGKVANGHHKLYYISRQEDLYQTSEFVKFILPHVGQWIVLALHSFATVFCVLGVFVWWPFVWMEEKGWVPGRVLRGGNILYDVQWKKGEIRSS
ncbi:hypothetical protein BBP40_005644 [Aspergillus hancockii]|nr:hypothetical protein BBP40_005644 [Aspergillus hancockii]